MPALVFDKYEVLERLAAGGMGEVLLARQLGGVQGFERLVILKTLLPELAKDPTFVDQFVDEARVVATLSHPNIVSVFEVGVWDGTYYLVMEYIPGPNLSQLRAAAARVGRPIPLPLCAQIGWEAALGLDHAHTARDLRGGRLGVVHRDVSPQNIMVRSDGVTKVVDFGIARASNRSSRTETGMVKGKLGYMPPEQLTGKELDGRADQFSLGVTLWELCCGRYLFGQKSDNAVIRALLTSTIPRPSELVSDFPPALEDTLMRMLEREPDRRFPRCYDAAQQLSTWLKEQSEPHDHAAIAAFIAEVDAFPDRKVTPPPANFVVAFKPQKGAGETRVAPPTPAPVPTTSLRPADVADTALLPDPAPQRPVARRGLGAWLAVGASLLAVAGAVTFWAWPPAPPVGPVAERVVVPPPEKVVATPPPQLEAPAEPPEPAPEPEPEVAAEPAAAPRPEPRRSPKTHAAAPKEVPPAAGVGQLTVRTTPYTVVSVDGSIVGSTPLIRSLPAGKHTVLMVNKDRGVNETRQVTVAAGATVKMDLVFDR